MAMSWRWLAVLAVALPSALAADQPTTTVVLSCPPASEGAPTCIPSQADLKKAKNAFSKALQLEKAKHLDEAYQEFDTAARLVPNNLDYVTALAVTREELVSQYVKQGNLDLEKGSPVQAQAEFRSALTLDPENQFAQQRLQDSMSEWTPQKPSSVKLVDSAGPAMVAPKPGHHDFHFRGDSQALLAQVAETFGITADVDPSVASRHVHFYIDNVDFFTAMRAACDVTGAFWTAVSDKQILFLKDTQENHRLYDRMAMRTFYVGFATTQQEMQDVTNLLRTIFEIRYVQSELQASRVVVRAPVRILDAATRLLENFGTTRPQVLLDIQVFEVDRQVAQDIGVHIPDTFNLINLPAAAFAALGGQNIQSLINQLIASGGINQANSSALSGLLAQLEGQQGQNSIFSQPVATFGGGATLMGLTLDMLTVTLSRNESLVKLLDHATLRAAQGNEANFRMGQRYPVINASFAPIFNSSAISQVLQNGSFQAPIPSFNYEDLGLDIKAKPVVSSDYNVSMDLDMELRSLAGESLNGVPVIANRSLKSSINLENGEPAIVASSISITEMRTLAGIPGLGSIPGIRSLTSSTSTSEDRDELLVLITPHIVNLEPPESTEVWIPRQ
jgi:general secretion pathway protein D